MAKQAQIDAVRPVLTAIDNEVTAAEHILDAVVSSTDRATDALESGLERVADVVPEAIDKGVHVTAEVTRRGVRAFRNPKTLVIVFGVSCVLVGVGAGIVVHKIQKKRLEKEYDERLEREIDEMRLHYIRRSKSGEFVTPRTAAEALLATDALEALQKYSAEETEDVKPGKDDSQLRNLSVVPKQRPDEATAKNQGTRYDKVVTDSEAAEAIREQVVTVSENTGSVARNIFVDGKPLVDDDWDAEIEEANRNPEFPYVISEAEFMENAYQHPQHSLTYFKDDDVLVDSDSNMIDNVDELIGTMNLANFGHGSKDPNIVYIRNEKKESDFEVALNEGKFAEQVLGLRHSDDSSLRFRRARWGDGE